MNEVNTCKNCKHWQNPAGYPKLTSDDDPQPRRKKPGKCLKLDEKRFDDTPVGKCSHFEPVE